MKSAARDERPLGIGRKLAEVMNDAERLVALLREIVAMESEYDGVEYEITRAETR